MNIVFGWVILVAVISAISWAPPLFDMHGGYGRAWREWNKIIIPLLLVVSALTALIMWALHLIGVWH
jgi:hypothetical protein